MSIYRKVVWYCKGLKEFTKPGYQNACKLFNPSDLDVNVASRSFMITGANSGLGKVVALEIAKKGGTVHIVCRNKERGEAAMKELQDLSGNSNIFLHILDLSRPKDVKNFAQEFVTSGKPLNVLINNAGALISGESREVTPDGLEMTFATNSLGTHMLTKEMLPVLTAAEDPRVIIVSSGGMLVEKLDLEDPQFEKMSSKFDGTMAYAQTKRQQVILASQYAKSYPKIHFSSMHPGWADTPGVRSSIPDFYEKMKDKLRSEEEGADTIVWLAVSPSATKHPSGLFFQDRKPVPTHLPLAWSKATPEKEQALVSMLDDFAKRF